MRGCRNGKCFIVTYVRVSKLRSQWLQFIQTLLEQPVGTWKWATWPNRAPEMTSNSVLLKNKQRTSPNTQTRPGKAGRICLHIHTPWILLENFNFYPIRSKSIKFRCRFSTFVRSDFNKNHLISTLYPAALYPQSCTLQGLHRCIVLEHPLVFCSSKND